MSECAASRHQNNRAFIRGLDILNGVDCSAQIPALVTVKDHAHQTPPPKINATARFLTLLTQVPVSFISELESFLALASESLRESDSLGALELLSPRELLWESELQFHRL